VWVRVSADQLAYSSLLQLAELLADGRLTPQQLAAVYLSRLRRWVQLLWVAELLTAIGWKAACCLLLLWCTVDDAI
jgi:hypothetical protein